jgi:hypothetical protein
MPIQSYKMNNGTLTVGVAPLDISCQLTSASVNPSENTDTEDAVPVLCGETLPSSDTVNYTFTLSGTLLQDLAAGGIIDYSWLHAGEEVPFTFKPDNAQPRGVTGTVRVAPLTIGGDVPTRPTSDFEWGIVGTPTFGAVTADDDAA